MKFMGTILKTFLLMALSMAIMISGCGQDSGSGKDGHSSKTSALQTEESRQTSAVFSYDTPAEIFRLAIKAMERGEFDKFREYHIIELRKSIDREYFDNQHNFFKTYGPVFEVTSEKVDGDDAVVDFLLKIEVDGETTSEAQKVEMKKKQGLWQISSL
ncbi:MAG: hypothetical protein CVV64_08020 [Candidatus Wallbacteria bacterium HGW-Wallbacteria-1]|jgi:hypothetical protein|uniref:DUF4878 domain-containing protein n=1 Tax=Candidatus Wallbacteria bacterium HGW-Wallbacteria-1 TaxID=2013854 RepID=A0A2N1PR57_9BACT|nr:MAG: hypothetical protein CVV64_08020 [Candidatus Wallbacteria bacterium HGW-Wallbacteria-1]